jgi:hypothetical protein
MPIPRENDAIMTQISNKGSLRIKSAVPVSAV